MLSSKASVVLYVVFVTVQGISGKPQQILQRESSADDAQLILHKLSDLISTTIVDADGKLADIQTGIESIASTYANGATRNLADTVKESFEQINFLKNRAHDLGIDASMCFGDQEQTILNLQATAVKDIPNCIEPKLEEAHIVVHEATQKVGDLVKIGDTFNNELTACEGQGHSECYKNVIARINLELSKVPSEAEDIVAKTTSAVDSIHYSIVNCLNKALISTVNTIKGIPKDITKCLLEIIGA